MERSRDRGPPLQPVPHTLYPVPCTLYPVPCSPGGHGIGARHCRRPKDFAWRAAPKEQRASALATKEAKVIDWIRGGNPWADQGWEQDEYGKYVKGPNHPDVIAYNQLQGRGPTPQLGLRQAAASTQANAFSAPSDRRRQLSRRTPGSMYTPGYGYGGGGGVVDYSA